MILQGGTDRSRLKASRKRTSRRRLRFRDRTISLIAALSLAAAPLCASEQKDLDELLAAGLEDLLEIEVVTASKAPRRLREVPATVRVVTAEQIRTRGYLSLEDALSDLPGFQFRNIVGFNSYVFQRGVPSQNNKILLLVDGVQINELNSGGFYGGYQYDLDGVERIEVVYGPGSVLYGTNAVSGIVNVITRAPHAAEGWDVSALYGSFDTAGARVAFGHDGGEDELGVTVAAMAFETEKADLDGADGDHNWTDDLENFEDDLSLTARFRLRDFEAGLVVQDKSASRSTNYTVDDGFRDRGTDWHIRFINGWLKHEFEPTAGWSLTSQLYYRNATVLDDTIAFIDSTSQVGYHRPNELAGIEAIGRFAPETGFRLTGGVVFEWENLATGFSRSRSDSPDRRPAPPPRPDMETNTLLSSYLQGEYDLTAELHLSGGLRFDSSSSYGEVVTPRIGLVFAKKRLSARLLYGEAFRAPKPWDYTNGLGNPDLDPEEMRSLEAAARFAFTTTLHGSLAVYRNVLDGILTREAIGESSRWINSGELETEGVEATIEHSVGVVDWWLGWTWTDSRDEAGDAIDEIARNVAQAGATVSLGKAVTVSLRGHYLGRRPSPKTVESTGSDRIDDAVVGHLALSWQPRPGWTAQLLVGNLADTEYHHTSNRPPDRYRQPQRSATLRLRYRSAP